LTIRGTQMVRDRKKVGNLWSKACNFQKNAQRFWFLIRCERQ